VGLVAVEQGLTLTKDREVVDTPTSVTSDLGARLVVYSATAAYALIFIGAAAVSYFAFLQPRFDLGNMTQAVWSTAHGHPLRMTTETGAEISRLGGHVDPFLVLLVPFWWIWSSPFMLLCVQAIAVSAGSIPVYWIARKHLHSSRLVTPGRLPSLTREIDARGNHTCLLHAPASRPSCWGWCRSSAPW